jgi:hypothetical protein
MKQQMRILVFVLVLSTLLVSACGATQAMGVTDPVSGGKPQAAPLEFTGIIESIHGNQWTINGQVITVDNDVIQDGPFTVGSSVKVEASVQPDGSIVVIKVETPDASDPQVADASETPEGASRPDPSSSTTPDPINGQTGEDNKNEATGVVARMDANTVVIGGQSFQITHGTEVKGQIAAGDFVKVEFVTNPDGSLSLVEIHTADPAQVDQGANSQGDSGKDGNHQSNDGPNHDNNNNNAGDHSGSGGSDDGSGHN